MEALIGLTPSGATAFASELYPGSTSDKEIVVKRGLLSYQLETRSWQTRDF